MSGRPTTDRVIICVDCKKRSTRQWYLKPPATASAPSTLSSHLSPHSPPGAAFVCIDCWKRSRGIPRQHKEPPVLPAPGGAPEVPPGTYLARIAAEVDAVGLEALARDDPPPDRKLAEYDLPMGIADEEVEFRHWAFHHLYETPALRAVHCLYTRLAMAIVESCLPIRDEAAMMAWAKPRKLFIAQGARWHRRQAARSLKARALVEKVSAPRARQACSWQTVAGGEYKWQA